MGAYSRGRQANRFSRIIDRIKGLTPEGQVRIRALAEAWAEGDGSDRGANGALTVDERRALDAFCRAIIEGRDPEGCTLTELADAMENVDGQPSGYDPTASGADRAHWLICEIVDEI